LVGEFLSGGFNGSIGKIGGICSGAGREGVLKQGGLTRRDTEEHGERQRKGNEFSESSSVFLRVKKLSI
jgi:hypothetical protein